MSHKEVSSSVVMVCGPNTEGKLLRVDEICSLNANQVVAAEDTIFALTNSGVYDVFTLTLAVNSPALGIDGGLTHNVLLSAEGELYAWGVGEFGELGLGPRLTDMEAPGQVRCSTRVTKVACGNSHSCAIDTFGNVYAWGQNFSRQLGLYTKSRAELPAGAMVEELVMTPRVLPFSLKHSVAKVACGAEFSLAVTKAGALWTWGAGESGQLGTGRCKVKEVPSECVVRVNGSAAKIADAAAGYGHCVALTADGQLAVWGLNTLGQLGTDGIDTVHEPRVLSTNFAGRSVYARDNSTACVTADGDLYTWGSGSSYRLLHGDCRTQYAPRRVEALAGESVSQFVFSTAAAAVLIKTCLFDVSPGIGMIKSFHSMELRGCGFWPSTSIVVKFCKAPEAGEEEGAALVPPRSCLGQLAGPGVISCKPPRLTHTGYYDVSLAMDGKNFLAETKRVFVCTDPTVVNIENCLYDLRESESIDITMSCAGLEEVGPGLDVYVRLVNCDDSTLCSPPILAELLPEDVFAEDGEDAGAGDDQSVAGSIASAGSFDQHEARDSAPAAAAAGGKRRILCRNVDLAGLKNRDGATLMLQAQLSRNSRDFAAANDERIICHEFTPSDAYPNCVPFASQREVTFRGSGFFPLGMQAAIAITTHVNAAPVDDKPKKKGKKDKGKAAASARPITPVSPENSVSEGLAEMPSLASLASVGSFIMESESPAFHVLTVPVRFDSVSELVITIPALSDFVRPGMRLPEKMPSVLKAHILFSLASDATSSLSKTEVEFFFYQEGAIAAAPALCRRFSGQSFAFSSVGNWLSFMPNAPKLIFSDKQSGFIQTVDAKAVPAEDDEFYQLVCELPGNERPPEPAAAVEAEGDEREGGETGGGRAPPAVLEQSESFLERPQVTYRSLQVGLLLDGVTPPEEANMCSVLVFDKVDILELSAPLPKEGATKGATISFNAAGLVPSDGCLVRLRGVNDASVDVAGSIDAVDDDGNGSFSFQMPESLQDIECHVKGKEKSVFVDVSIDGGSTWDKSEAPILVVGKY